MTDSLHVLFSDEGQPVAIRKWSKEPFDDAVEYVRKSDYNNLIAACDAALDWADANARAFPIETAPRERWIEFWDKSARSWRAMWLSPHNEIDVDFYTHWREPLPPPSNPRLPEHLERLGEVLQKVKGIG